MSIMEQERTCPHCRALIKNPKFEEKKVPNTQLTFTSNLVKCLRCNNEVIWCIGKSCSNLLKKASDHCPHCECGEVYCACGENLSKDGFCPIHQEYPPYQPKPKIQLLVIHLNKKEIPEDCKSLYI